MYASCFSFISEALGYCLQKLSSPLEGPYKCQVYYSCVSIPYNPLGIL